MKTTLTFTSRKEKKKGEKDGRQWVIWSYTDGVNWYDSFDEIELNTPVEVFKTINANPKWNDNISLKDPGGKKSGLTEEQVVKIIEEKLEPIYKHLNIPHNGLPF